MYMDNFEYSYYENVYATHQPFLEAYVRATKGDVLEFGTGEGSTGLLRTLLKGSGRQLISIEDNKEWLDKMMAEYPPTETHTYIYLEPKENGAHWKDFLSTFSHPNQISVTFIDQAPWEARIWTYEALSHQSEYCIIHDVDYFPLNGLFGKITDANLPFSEPSKYDFSEHFVSYAMYFPPPPWTEKNHGPPTLVGTNHKMPILDWNDIEFP
jgi:hypothetical protein